MTVRDWVQSAKLRLESAGVESAGLEAQLLAGHVLLVPRSWLMAHPEEPFPELAGESLLVRRLGHEPLPYILGSREFYSRRFRVCPGVLIPRQETEILVETALKWLRKKQPECRRVLDLGTGSGCIAITLKLEEPSLNVSASDVSSRALEIAEDNAREMKAVIDFFESDVFGSLQRGVFDMIVTNPPYIGRYEPLAPELTEYEPYEALFSGPTGMEFYERLSLEAAAYLADDGMICMEVGYRQADGVNSVFENAGWLLTETIPDLSGVPRVVVVKHNPRILSIKRPSDAT